MSAIVSGAIITTVCDFAAKVGMNLYVAWHFGRSSERAERYRARLKQIDEARKQKELK